MQDEHGKDVFFGVAEEGIYVFSHPAKVHIDVYKLLFSYSAQEYLEQFLFSHLRGWAGIQADGGSKYKGKLSAPSFNAYYCLIL